MARALASRCWVRYAGMSWRMAATRLSTPTSPVRATKAPRSTKPALIGLARSAPPRSPPPRRPGASGTSTKRPAQSEELSTTTAPSAQVGRDGRPVARVHHVGRPGRGGDRQGPQSAGPDGDLGVRHSPPHAARVAGHQHDLAALVEGGGGERPGGDLDPWPPTPVHSTSRSITAPLDPSCRASAARCTWPVAAVRGSTSTRTTLRGCL